MRDMALNLEKKSEIAAAERAYRQILTMRPDDALTLYRLGRLLAARAEHAEAARLLARSTAIDPGGDNAWLKLAHSLHALGDDAAALAACRQVVRLKPTNEEAKRLIVHLALAGRRGPAVVFGAEDSPAPTWNQLSAAAWSLPRPAVALARP
jgi:tetratricopeptide (TPR) repeat protein